LHDALHICQYDIGSSLGKRSVICLMCVCQYDIGFTLGQRSGVCLICNCEYDIGRFYTRSDASCMFNMYLSDSTQAQRSVVCLIWYRFHTSSEVSSMFDMHLPIWYRFYTGSEVSSICLIYVFDNNIDSILGQRSLVCLICICQYDIGSTLGQRSGVCHNATAKDSSNGHARFGIKYIYTRRWYYSWGVGRTIVWWTTQESFPGNSLWILKDHIYKSNRHMMMLLMKVEQCIFDEPHKACDVTPEDITTEHRRGTTNFVNC
jgi:hypothetical protein